MKNLTEQWRKFTVMLDKYGVIWSGNEKIAKE